MSACLLDASVWLAAVDDRDPFHRAARELVSRADVDVRLAALDLTLLEIANVAVIRWRAPALAERLLELVPGVCANRVVRCDQRLAAAAAADIAGRDRLSVYDAAYVAAAEAHGWVLVSTDFRDLVQPGHAVAPDGVA